MADKPLISVIIPCRNEAPYIARCLDSILATTYPNDRIEVIVVDGASDDGTPAKARDYALRFPQVHLIDNPARITPVALNLGIKRALGDIIVRMDAHNIYPPNYLTKLVEWLLETGADNVGTAWHTRPANETVIARAIAAGLSHSFGVGNAYFRLGVTEPRWVDTVPFGCYRRSVFERIGLFDEELLRNQDDEFNARLIRAGGRILLVPDVTSDYFARETVRKLWRMYWQYGLFKPLTIRKIGAIVSARQLVPSFFVLFLTAASIAGLWWWPATICMLAVLGVYLAALAGACFSIARQQGVRVGAATAVVFPTLHFAYGLGFLAGLRKAWPPKRDGVNSGRELSISR